MHDAAEHKTRFFKNTHHGKIVVVGVGFEAVNVLG
jgi:hypothetical protein